jgi:hypothetical protein
MSSTMWTTTLSMLLPPQTSKSSAPSDAGLQHTLVVDLREADATYDRVCATVIHAYSPEYSLFVDRLQAIVECDGKDHPRIDMVHILCSMNLPDETIYEVLKGLRPRHFNLQSSVIEECRLESLERLAWPLENLIICSACADYEGEEPSDVVRLIPSLTLDYCFHLFFAPATNAAVRHLTITQNNAVDMFIDLVEKFGVANDLQTLKIQSGNIGNDFSRYSPGDFTKTLKQCTSLLSLDLAPEISDEDKYGNRRSYLCDLPQYFPDSVESLRFSGPVAMADDFSTWLQYATDPSWMPNLQSLAFRLYSSKKSSPTTLVTEPHVQRFLDTMLASHPGLQIVS